MDKMPGRCKDPVACQYNNSGPKLFHSKNIIYILYMLHICFNFDPYIIQKTNTHCHMTNQCPQTRRQRVNFKIASFSQRV